MIYAAGISLYGWYLDQYTPAIDPISVQVAEHAAVLLRWIFPEVSVVLLPGEPVADLRYDWFSLVKVIEGCNAVSIFLLFISFLFAFKGRTQHYMWFIPTGALVLHLSNIIRISLMGYVFYFHRTYTDFFHDYAFPSIIYGTVVLLWILWVKLVVQNKHEEAD